MRITSTAFKLGSITETLEELCLINPSWQYEKLLSKTGIKERHIINKNETAETMAYESASLCIKEIDKSDIDGVIFVTQSPTSSIPTRACILQNKLGLSKNLIAFDVNQGCSGFTYALSIANALIKDNNLSKILIICSDIYSSYISINDRTSRPIFSDGSASVILDSKEDGSIGPFVFGTDGSGADYLTLKYENKLKPYLFMDGPEVLKFTMRTIPLAVKKLLDKASLNMEDIDLFVFHQASAVVLNKLKKILKIPNDRWFLNIEKFGNTVSSTIPIALHLAKKNGQIGKNQKIMLMGFGVGLSYSGCIINT